MDDLQIRHNGETYRATWLDDHGWFVEADWVKMKITPPKHGYPLTDGRLEGVPDHLSPEEAVHAYEAVRHKMVTAALESTSETPKGRLKAALENLVHEAKDAADALESLGDEGDEEMLRDEIQSAEFVLEQVD